MKRKIWIVLALAVLIAAVWCTAAFAEYAFTSFDRESPVVIPDDDGVYRGHVSWQVNFVPTAIKIYRIDGIGAGTTTQLVQDLPVTATSTTLEAGNRYNLFIYYGDPNNANERVYQQFIIAQGSPTAELTQTVFPSIVNPNEKAAFKWSTNFTPTRIEIRNADTEAVIATLPGTATSWDQFDRNISYEIWFYHNNIHVDRTVWIRVEGWAFETQPTGGNIVPEGSRRVSWSTNFTPVKVEIGHTVNSGWPSFEKEFVTDDTIKTNLGKSMSYDVPYSFEESSRYVVRAYYEDAYGNYAESDEFSITKTDRSFTTQPFGGNIFPEDSIRLSWSTNFTPVKVVIGHTVNSGWPSFEKEFVTDDTIKTNLGKSMSYDVPYSFEESSRYVVRAYYEDAYGTYVESDEFSITKDDRKFTTDPADGTISPNGGLSMRWTTNFLPIKVEIGYKTGDTWNSIVTLTQNMQRTMSYLLTYNSAHETMYIRAWYDSEHAVESNAIAIEIIPRQFTAQPTGGTVYPWTTYQLRWTTNFFPTKIEIGYRESRTGGWVKKAEITTGLGRTMNYALSYDVAINGTMYVRAFYGTEAGEWVGSETVSIAKKEAYTCGNDLTAILADGTLTINGTGPMYDYGNLATTLPPWYNIRNEITSVVIADGVTAIGEYSFISCANMTSVVLPVSVTSVGRNAFQNCTSLHYVNYDGFKTQWDTVDIDGSNTNLLNATVRYLYRSGTVPGATGGTISWSIFGEKGYLSISGSGYLPDGQTPWYEYAQYLTEINVQYSVKGIGEENFRGCTQVTTVRLPGCLAWVKANAFHDCTAITDVYFEGIRADWNKVTKQSGNEPLSSANLHTQAIYDGLTGDLSWSLDDEGLLTVFFDDSNMGDGEDTDIPDFDGRSQNPAPWDQYSSQIKTIRVGRGVTRIGTEAFINLNQARTLDIADTVTSIGEDAFASCTRLEDFTFPDSVKIIGTHAFKNCYSLEFLTLPDSIEAIYTGAFENCTNLEVVYLPSGLQVIDDECFKNCGLIDRIYIPSAVTYIGVDAFADCSTLQDSFSHVYYGGTSAQWKAIDVDSGNDDLINAGVIHMTPEELRIDAANFPDEAFRTAVANAFDTDHSGWLTDAEIAAADGFGTEDTDYTTIQGMEYFTEMTSILLDGAPSLTNIDLTANTKLRYVDVCYNGLTEVNIEGLYDLVDLDVSQNALSTFDVSDFDLERLVCYTNPMTSLTLGNQPALRYLSCFGTDLVTLDLRGCPLLLDCLYNGTKTVAANYVEYKVDNTHLLRMDAGTELIIPGMVATDAAHFPDARFLNVVKGFDTNNSGWLSSDEIAAVTEIIIEESADIANVQGIEYFTELEYLTIGGASQLTAIDLSANRKLTSIDLYDTGLTALDVTGLPLEFLNISRSPLNSLTLGAQPNLSYLSVYGPDVTIPSLDLRPYPHLLDAVMNGTREVSADHVQYVTASMDGVLIVNAEIELIIPGTVRIDEAHFPDETFRLWVYDIADSNGSGWLSEEEINAIEEIYLNVSAYAGLTSVQGIEYFMGITELIIADTPNLTAVDLSANTKIESLEITDTGLTSLILENQPQIYSLVCYGNSLTELDISGCPHLVRAYHGSLDTSRPEYDMYTSDDDALYVSKGMHIEAGDPAPTFTLPAALTTIEAEAFSGIAAEAVRIPASVTDIQGNPFAGSDVQYIYGTPGTAAETFAKSNGYIFVPDRE